MLTLPGERWKGTQDTSPRQGFSRRVLPASFFAALAVILGIHFLSQVNRSMLGQNQRSVDHTLEVLGAVNTVRYYLVQVRAGSNGYVISGEENYLASYYDALERLPAAASRLRLLTADNPQQQQRCDRLNEMVDTYVQHRAYVVSERRTRGLQAAVDAVRATQGREFIESILESILTLLSEVDQHEQALLVQRTRKVQASDARFTLISWTGGVISVVMLVLVFYYLRRENALRSRAEAEHRRGQVLLESILNSMGDGVVAADAEGRFTVFNAAAEKILGQGASSVDRSEWSQQYGVFLGDGITPYPAHKLPLALALQGQSVDRAEMRLRRKGEEQPLHWLSVSARPIRTFDGDLAGAVAVFGEITEAKRAEDAIRSLNQALEQRIAELDFSNRELEAFTYSVSHDLRAPLRQVHGFSRILTEQYGAQLDSQGQHYLRRVETGAAQMGVLIDDLLNLSRLGRRELKREPTALARLVEEVRVELEADINGRRVEWRIQPLPQAECDPRLMKQVFANLLANALKYTRPREQAVIEVGQTAGDGEQAIFVRDNGVGFSMKYADKLFGVFQRLHRSDEFEGTGVGLATVQRIVQKHGGRIWAEGEEDKGATFSFTLGQPGPSSPQPAASAEATT
jgi:PAS domain S-box-containing protein